MKITGLIISAGLSGRMGRLKPLIEFDGKTFLEHIITKLDMICSKIIIVTGFQSNRIINETENRVKSGNKELLKKLNWQHNPDYEKGMLTSLQTGLKAAQSSDWFIYHFVDQPNIPEPFYSALAQQIDTEFEWLQPVYNGKSGHPIVISKKLTSSILSLTTNQSLRDLRQNVKIKQKKWLCNFKEILQDFDTPQQLKNL